MQRQGVDEQWAGPGWPILPPSMAIARRAGVRTVLWSNSAARWYVGAALADIWLIAIAVNIAQEDSGPAPAWGIALVVLFGIAFAIAAPLCWALPRGTRLFVPTGLFLLSLTLVPWLAWGVSGLWTYVGVIIGMAVLSWGQTWWLIFGLAALGAVFEFMGNGWSEGLFYGPVIILSISMMMASFARVLASMNQLTATQREMERLAAEQERSRVARDMHDILGHSLTVITVKAELARRLMDVDPERARREIGEVEDLSRVALADVRSTVAGFRGVNLVAELAAARSALSSAGITADLPSTTDAVPPERRELAAWVVREGVTNVIRHSGAHLCRVRLDADAIEVADDGIGVASQVPGTGLTGLRERAEAVGARLSMTTSELGGLSLMVRT
ncbi:sensor histidine kinase [Rathayibacter sp. YIM 133350]|uniref:sensor histidine kinase n=1 Tax=Rathayibacter sp. YIM 133350 TaxID=3131992 RepID=UPI00307FABAB